METKNKACVVVTLITILLISQIRFGFDDGDFQYWNTAGASLDIDKDWKFTFNERLQ